MRVALLLVAFMAMIALASAASITLTGTWYTDDACSAGATAITAVTTSSGTGSSATATLGCAVVTGTGSAQTVLIGICTASSFPTAGGATVSNTFSTLVYTASTGCPASGATSPTGTLSASASDTAFSAYPDNKVVTSYGTGCFTATSCSYSGASTLVVPSILLVALAFAARKLAL